MEYLFFAILLYFILRIAGNLLRLLEGDGASPSPDEQAPETATPEHRWKGPSPRQETGAAREEPTFWGEDIEEATWRDLDRG
jgi:hypothetical protein